MKKIQQGVIVAVALAVVAIVTQGASTVAQSVSADSLKVSPVRTDIAMNPGETKTIKVTVTNPSSDDVVVRPVQNDFIAADEKGTPALILDETSYAPKHSLKRFMKPMSTVPVPAKSTVTVELILEVPASAEPGGYFGALRFTPANPVSGAQVNLDANIASIILLRVNGVVPERLTLTDFSIQRGGSASTFFRSGEDMTLTLRFQNDGGVQLGPIGRISVTQGDDIVYETNFNNRNRQDMILPDSARRWGVPLGQIEGFGRYTVTALFTYGSKNQSIEVTKTFWIIPTWVMISVGVIFIIAVAGIVMIVHFIRKRRRAKRPRARTGLRVR